MSIIVPRSHWSAPSEGALALPGKLWQES